MPNDEGDYRDGLLPEDRLRIIVQIWKEIRISGYTGATNWVVLEEIEQAVRNVMSHDTPDVNQAESLTFKALHLIVGNIKS